MILNHLLIMKQQRNSLISLPRSLLMKIWHQNKSVLLMKHHCFGITAPRKTRTTAGETALTWIKAKGRITVLGCANAAGTQKCKLAVISQSLCPCSFKWKIFFPSHDYPNKKAWITDTSFLIDFTNILCQHLKVWLDDNWKVCYSLTTILLIHQLKFT
jgi:hypothetical protein